MIHSTRTYFSEKAGFCARSAEGAGRAARANLEKGRLDTATMYQGRARKWADRAIAFRLAVIDAPKDG